MTTRDQLPATTSLENSELLASLNSSLSPSTQASDLKNLQKVLIPLIRRIVPAMVVSNMVGVQPMTRPINETGWTINDDTFNSYPYAALITNWSVRVLQALNRNDPNDEMETWTIETFAPGSWHRVHNGFRFKNEHDRTVFLLRWPL